MKTDEVELDVAGPLVLDDCRWSHAIAGLGYLQKS